MTDIESREVFKGRIIRLTLEPSSLPGGAGGTMEIIHHPGGAAVVLLDAENRVCLLRQYRHAFRRMIWELPAGKLDNGEAPDICVRREAREEAGVEIGGEVGELISLGHMLSSPGVFTEVVHLFLARDLHLLSGNSPEPGEWLEVHWLDWTQVLSWCKNGTIEDAKSLIALFRAAQYLDDLG